MFMEPNWDELMVCPYGTDPNDAQSQSAAANLPPGVPPLKTRWRASDGVNCVPQTFAEFSEETHKSYY